MSKRRILGFVCGIAALALIVGSWAYYSSTSAVENKLQTSKYGNELVEKFTPTDNWQPGQVVTKEVGVENTGDYDLFVRIKMSETWTLASGSTPANITIASSQAAFRTATALNAVQGNLTDGLTTGDESVVYKALAASGWTYNALDGYWYYNSKLAKATSTGALLEAITLAGDTDMGKYTEVKYYTKAATKPNNTDISTDHADAGTKWVVYTGTVPTGTTFTRSVSQLGDAGYAGAGYVLTITSETLQATQEAFTASSSTWGSTPQLVKDSWGVS